MYWIPRSTNHPVWGNLVCFKWAQLPNPFCYKHVQLKNIYLLLSFGDYGLQVQLFIFLRSCFLAWSKITALTWEQSTSSEAQVRAHALWISVRACTEQRGFRGVNPNWFQTSTISMRHLKSTFQIRCAKELLLFYEKLYQAEPVLSWVISVLLFYCRYLSQK